LPHTGGTREGRARAADAHRSAARMAAQDFILFGGIGLRDASIFDQIEDMCRRLTV